MHDVAFVFGITRIELYDIAKSFCPGEVLDLDLALPISFSRNLASLSFYYQQFGYQIKPESLVLASDMEKSLKFLKNSSINPFFRELGLNINRNMTFAEYFKEFNNRSRDISCPNTALLLNTLLFNPTFTIENISNIDLQQLLDSIKKFFDQGTDRFFYTLSIQDLL